MGQGHWRFPDSRGVLRASINYISQAVGISHATVSRALQQLRQRELISIQEINFKLGNLCRVSPMAAGRLRSARTFAVTQSEAAHNEIEAGSLGEGNSLDASTEATQSEGETRSSKLVSNESSTLIGASPRVREYLSKVHPIAKRAREWRAYRELRRSYTDTQIDLCVEWLLTHGIPGTGEPSHSPLAYLSQAFAGVLDLAEKEQARQRKLEQARALLAERERRERLQEEADERELAQREAAFPSAFPSAEEQARFVLEASKDFPFFNPHSPALRSIVVARWYANRSNENEATEERMTRLSG